MMKRKVIRNSRFLQSYSEDIRSCEECCVAGRVVLQLQRIQGHFSLEDETHQLVSKRWVHITQHTSKTSQKNGDIKEFCREQIVQFWK